MQSLTGDTIIKAGYLPREHAHGSGDRANPCFPQVDTERSRGGSMGAISNTLVGGKATQAKPAVTAEQQHAAE